MVRRRLNVGKSGITGIEIAIIGVMFTIGFALSIAIPVFFLRIHLVRVLEIQYGYDNAGTSLMALLSDKAMYKNISLYMAGARNNADIGFSRAGVEDGIKHRLDRLVGPCYTLTYSGGDIVKAGSCDAKYSASASVVLPDGEDNEEVTLWIQSVFEGKTTPEFEFDAKTWCCYEPLGAGRQCVTKDTCLSAGWELDPIPMECQNVMIDCMAI